MAKRRLTQQQRRRIEELQNRRREKAASREENPLPDEESPIQQGRILTRHGNNLWVEDSEEQQHLCRFRQNLGHLVCGDRVLWQASGNRQGVVSALLPRTSTLIRPTFGGSEKPLAANLDTLIIVLAPEPAPQRYLIDQYLISAEHIGLQAILCLNKADLLDDRAMSAFSQEFGDYTTIGYPLVTVSCRTKPGLSPLIGHICEKTSILVGQSGVGKSSLVSALVPDQKIQTGKLSDTTGKGCHTTTATCLYHLPQGGDLIDSPGVRSFRPLVKNRAGLEQGYREFQPWLGHCQFSNCRHDQEPGCALISAVERGKIDPRRLETFRHMAANLE